MLRACTICGRKQEFSYTANDPRDSGHGSGLGGDNLRNAEAAHALGCHGVVTGGLCRWRRFAAERLKGSQVNVWPRIPERKCYSSAYAND